MSGIYLSLGSNIGNRLHNLAEAIVRIERFVGKIEACSSVYETTAWGHSSQNYLNVVVKAIANPDSFHLLEFIKSIEHAMGKVSAQKSFADRIIDIDILDFNNQVITTKELCLPHPLFHLRNFCVVPLHEIASSYIHPVFGLSIQEFFTFFENDKSILKYLPQQDFILILKHGHTI